MLGDGYINLNHKAPRFCFLHSLKDKEYAVHCYNLFSSYLPYGENCSRESYIYDKRTNKRYGRIYYQSMTAPILRKFYLFWYPDGYKKIPLDWVERYLEADGLALWYQDDGCLKNKDDRIILSTDAFQNEEVSFLKKLLKRKFKINSTIDSQGRLDISSRREVRKFQSLIEPFIHLSMERKSMMKNFKSWKYEWERKEEKKTIFRTSLYLPYDLYIKIRGQGYSKSLNVLLGKWLERQWKQYLIDPSKIYEWIVFHENIRKGKCLLTPRFKSDIKRKLDLLSMITGFERSEIVTMALIEKN